jgi:hypothetical protein
LIGIGTAGAQPPPPGYARIPPPRVEVVPPPPGRHVVWEPGHWQWNGYRYGWVPGRYVSRQPHYRHYAQGHWVWSPRQGRYIWVAPHWE